MTKLVRIVFTPSGKSGQVPAGTTVLNAARALGVDLDSVCGGRGICSKCQIAPSFGQFDKHKITAEAQNLSEPNAVEERYERVRGLKPGRRLGCQTQILGDMVIDVPPESQMHQQLIRKSLEESDIAIDPALRFFSMEMAAADLDSHLGQAERLQSLLPLKTQALSLNLTRKLQDFGAGKLEITVLVHQKTPDDDAEIIDLWQGQYEGRALGLAVDLGSTTIAAHLIDLLSGDRLASAGVMNPQIRFGEDLMSRVSYAMMNENGAAEMTKAIRESLNLLIDGLVKEANVERAEIFDMVLVGNPVMHHILLGLDPTPLGQSPFPLAMSNALNTKTCAIDINLHDNARLYILPLIAGHVGADAAAVVLATAPQDSDELTLICDVGTNAEIILGDKNHVLACSSPTGPAFEGAQISSGQRAAKGAIERAEIDPVSKALRFRVIGSELWSDDPDFDSEVTGICGSGIIELIAEMRMAGIVDANGLIGSAEATGSDRIFSDGRTFSFMVHDARPDGPLISVTNKDIREIQLAKAALYAGARLLMDKRGVDHVDKVLLAGAFGAHISVKHAMVLGMIPDCDFGAVKSVGNAAGTGARACLLNRNARSVIENLVFDIEKIETAIEPRFQEHFVHATNIPNAADPFEKLRHEVDLPDVNFNSNNTRSRRRGARS